MRNVLEIIKWVVIVVLALAAAGAFIYGCYWLTKTLSYSFFYEDMVQRTITEMVKPEYLK